MRWHGPALTESAAMHPWHSLPVVASRSRSGPRGFTLIEVMITVAVIAVLSALAYPAYTDYIRRGKRATAQAVLLELAGKQQTYLLDRRADATAVGDLGFTAPNEIRNDYSFEIVGVDNAAAPPLFTVRAAPLSDAQKAKSEPTLTVDQVGAKSPAGYWSK